MVDLARPVLDVGLVVRDMEKALAFYRDKLGFTPTRRISLPGPDAEQAGIGTSGLDIQYMQAGDANLKLVALDKQAPASPFGADAASGYRYVTLWVKDLGHTYDDWKAKGVEFLSEPIRRTPEMRMVFVKDPDGNLIELLGP